MISMSRLDIKDIRKDFPILGKKIKGKPLVYLDNAATSQKPAAVINKLIEFYTQKNANVHRGVHELSEQATEEYEGVRKKVAKLVGTKKPEEIIHTRGTTESINMVARSLDFHDGDKIVITEMEHHSNIVPWQLVARAKNLKLDYISLKDDGTLNEDDFSKLEGAKIFAFTHVSNVLGTINDVKQLVKLAHEAGALALVDGAQAVPHMPVDIGGIGADFYAFSGHKMLGPTGTGILWGRKELLEKMEPFMGGGDMIKTVQMSESTWNALPWKFEAGTPNIAGVIALGTAIDYLEKIGMKNVRDHEKEITGYALEQLSKISSVKIYGPGDAEKRGGVISFNVGDVHSHDVATILNEEGIAIRSGHHCAQPIIDRFRVKSMSRASFYIYNTTEEIDKLVHGIEKAKKVFGVN